MKAAATAVALLILPFSAMATLITTHDPIADYLKVSYAGTVMSIEGAGFGYSVGDRVTGTMWVDVRIAPPNTALTDGTGLYINRGTNVDFVTGLSPDPDRALKGDFVYVWDADFPSVFAPAADGFAVGDSSRDDFPGLDDHGAYSQTSTGVTIGVGYHFSDGELHDFIGGVGMVQSFDVSGNHVGNGSIGTITHEYFRHEENAEITNLAHFILQSVSVSPGVCHR